MVDELHEMAPAVGTMHWDISWHTPTLTWMDGQKFPSAGA
jgi:hypothetical protein